MWQITGVLGIALLVTAGAFKMYADKTEAEKEAMAMDLRQASDNQLVLETSISNLNKQLTEAEERQQNILDRVNELQAANAQAQKEVESIRKKFSMCQILIDEGHAVEYWGGKKVKVWA